MPDLELSLVVGGAEYRGWKGISMTRSMETVAGQFSLDVSDRWGALQESWPIREEDPCQIVIGDETVLDGWIDKRSPSLSGNDVSFNYSGKDRAGALVESSGIVTGASAKGNKWTYSNVSVLDFCTTIAKPFGIGVKVQPGLTLTKVSRIVTHPGDTAFEMMSKAASDAGVLLVSDGAGGVVITRAGTDRARALVQGSNVLAASGDFDATDRFYRYLIASQVPGTEEESGEQANVIAEAIDSGVQRQHRVLLIRPDKSYGRADSKRRADWEARIRAARAEKFQITVRGWKQGADNTGDLWSPNTLTTVSIPRIGLNGVMLISQVQYSLNAQGQVTVIHVVRPDAFTPEPKAVVVTEGAWKELKDGGR